MENYSDVEDSNQSQLNHQQKNSNGSVLYPESFHSQKLSNQTAQSQVVNGSQLKRKSSTQNKNEALIQNNDQKEHDEFNDLNESQNHQDSFNQIENQVDKSNQQEQDNEAEQTFHQDQSKMLENVEDQDFQELQDQNQRKRSDEQSNNQTQITKEENQSNIILKQVPTEITDNKQNEDDNQNNDKMLKTQEVIEKFKQVIKSPKTRSPQLSSEDPYQLNKPIIKPLQLSQQDNERNYDKIVDVNLKEIYKFYSKQAQTSNKQNTFDQLHQIQQVMTLQKYMYFCKDFELIDLEINNDFIYQYTGSAATKPLNKIKYKHKEKENLVVNKVMLVEIFKKCSNIQELSYQEFLYALIKIGDLIFPVDNSLRALYDYLGVHDPKIYRKKMVVVGKPFNTKDQSEVLTQEKLCSRRLILPAKPKPRAESYKQEPLITNVNNISVQEKPKNSAKNLSKQQKDKSNNLIKWEDLGNVTKEFDPKELLLEQDLSDKEDEYYLQEYLITTSEKQKKDESLLKGSQKKQQNNSKQQEQQNQHEDKLQKQNDHSQSVPNQQKLYKQLVNQQQTQQTQPQTNQSPMINQSNNQTPLLLSKQKNILGGRQSLESQCYSQSYKAQQIKLNKQSTKAALNTSVEHSSPNTIRKENDGINAIKRIEAEKKQREQQIFVNFMKNQEQREKKVNKK